MAQSPDTILWDEEQMGQADFAVCLCLSSVLKNVPLVNTRHANVGGTAVRTLHFTQLSQLTKGDKQKEVPGSHLSAVGPAG